MMESSSFVKRMFMISKSTLRIHPILPAITLIWRFPYLILHALPSRKVKKYYYIYNYSKRLMMKTQKKNLTRRRKRFWSRTENSKCYCFGRRLWESTRIPMGRWWVGWVGTDIRWAACGGRKVLFICVEGTETRLDDDFQRLESILLAISFRRLNEVYIVLVQMRPSLGATHRQTEWFTSTTGTRTASTLRKFIYKEDK